MATKKSSDLKQRAQAALDKLNATVVKAIELMTANQDAADLSEHLGKVLRRAAYVTLGIEVTDYDCRFSHGGRTDIRERAAEQARAAVDKMFADAPVQFAPTAKEQALIQKVYRAELLEAVLHEVRKLARSAAPQVVVDLGLQTVFENNQAYAERGDL
jgi:hypothetical protein